MNFDMVDYDARKYFTYLQIRLFCASNPPYKAYVMHLSRYAAPSIAVFGGNNPKGLFRDESR